MKKIRLSLIMTILLIFCFALISCSLDNRVIVKDNDKSIKAGIEKLVTLGSKEKASMVIKNKCYLDNFLVVSYSCSSNNYTGYASLKKYGKDSYNILSSSYGTNVIDSPVITTDKGKYLLAIGYEYNQELGFVKLGLDNKRYIYEINGEKNFIQYYAVPDKTTASFGMLIGFYDKSNKDISADLELK